MKRLLVVLAWSLAACGPVDVVVAFVPDGGPRPPPGRPCTSNDDCASIDYCERRDCDDVAGHCVHRPTPTFCDAVAAPVCSCDGVTYLNDCYRRLNGATASVPGECTVGATCTASSACPERGWCARVVPACGVDPTTGRCWWVPPSCPGVGAFQACGGGACTDLCSAVRLETAHEPCP